MRVIPIAAALTMFFGLLQGAPAQTVDYPAWGRGAFGRPGGIMKCQVGQGYLGAPGMMRSGPGLNHLLFHGEAIGLSDVQVEKIKALRLEHVKRVSELRSRLAVAELELQDLMVKPEVNMAAVESKTREVSSLRGDLAVDQVKARVEAVNILTPEQRKKARELARAGQGMAAIPRDGMWRRRLPRGPGGGMME